MTTKVIINPAANNGRSGKLAAQITDWGQALGDLSLVTTEYAGHAQELAQAAAASGHDRVVAVGGDGTVHEVVNGLFHANQPGVKLGIVPAGSGNDLAFALGIPMDMKTAVSHLASGYTRPIDLVRIEDENGRSCVVDNNIGIGFDAMVVVLTQKIRRIHGFLKYLTAVLQAIAFYYETPHLEMQFDNDTAAQKVLFLAMGVGFRGGGGFLLTPDARHDDNLIDSCLVNPINRLTMLNMLGKAIKGTHIHSRHVTMRQSKQIIVKSDRPMPIHIDGELFARPEDNVRQVTMTSLPAAIEVIA
ncbi:MAG: diacylglycerol kinase family lipid kinase [Anaerolineales bacterium]|nr:diacylglycerol kinase family lipid kinase [Anaerolineales bacterium]MCA9927202.1 diacylglycerol kinase family lipid kinase [Anaerolineales bacterium]